MLSGILLAHGLGDADVLPFPVPVLAVVVAAALVAWGSLIDRRSPPGARDSEPAGAGADGIALPAWVTAVLDAPVTRAVARLAGVVSALAVIAVAAVGPADADANPATRLVLVVFWAGLVPLSLLAPGAWKALNPLRTASALLGRLTGDPDERSARPLPDQLGWRPAAVGLAAFALMDAALPPEPTVVLGFLAVYGLVQLGAAAVYGSGWYQHGDAFEVLASVVGRLSPLRRGTDSRFGLGSPRVRLRAPLPPGATPVLGILVGAALADFVADTGWWRSLLFGRSGVEEALIEAGGLAVCVAVATGVAALPSRGRALLPAVLPVVPAYLVLHYFAVLLIEGQIALRQVGAVLGGGLEALERTPMTADYDLLPGALAAGLTLTAFLVAHLLGVTIGSDLARDRAGRRRAGALQAPLRAVLVVSAVAGIALRFSAA